FPGLSVEIPGGAFLEWSGDHRLRRIKLNQLAVEIDSRPANNSVVVDAQQVGIGDRARPVHFELEEIFSINVLRSFEAVQNRQANLAVGVWFHIENFQSISNFLGHVVAPAVTRRSWNERSS